MRPSSTPLSRWKSWRNKLTASMLLAALPIALGQAPSASADIFYGHNIGGRILDEFYEASNYNGMSYQDYFGPAITPESLAAQGGRWQAFERSNSIYWHPLVSNGHANQIGGAIRTRWGQPHGWAAPEYTVPTASWENGPLLYPTTREMPTQPSGANGVTGRFNHFEGGSIYYSDAGGAQVVWGAIRDQWASQGWEAGTLGFPTGPELRCTPAEAGNGYGAFVQSFQGGELGFGVPEHFEENFSTPVRWAGASGWVNQYPNYATVYRNPAYGALASWDEVGTITSVEFPSGDGNLQMKELHDRPDLTWAGRYYDNLNPPHEVVLNASPTSANGGGIGASNPALAEAVWAHEIGHAYNLKHSCTDALMNYTVSSSLVGPQSRDIAALNWVWR